MKCIYRQVDKVEIGCVSMEYLSVQKSLECLLHSKAKPYCSEITETLDMSFDELLAYDCGSGIPVEVYQPPLDDCRTRRVV